MNTVHRAIWAPLACALLSCALAGCRSDPSVALMEAEMRWLEDQYYALEEEYQLKCQELQSCRLANQAIADPRSRGDSDSVPEELPSSRRTPDGQGDETLPIRPPQIEGGPAFPTPATGSGVRPSSFEIPIDTQVTQIALNRQLTGGYDRDGRPGDDGVMVVIEPRNAAEQFVAIAGEVTIALVDPRVHTPSRATVAKWKLTSRQAAAKMRQSLLGRGVHLELPWPGEPPAAGEFELEVRYTTASGQSHAAKRTIQLDPPRDASTRWTPTADLK